MSRCRFPNLLPGTETIEGIPWLQHALLQNKLKISIGLLFQNLFTCVNTGQVFVKFLLRRGK
jgi:hypothetical protein